MMQEHLLSLTSLNIEQTKGLDVCPRGVSIVKYFVKYSKFTIMDLEGSKIWLGVSQSYESL